MIVHGDFFHTYGLMFSIAFAVVKLKPSRRFMTQTCFILVVSQKKTKTLPLILVQQWSTGDISSDAQGIWCSGRMVKHNPALTPIKHFHVALFELHWLLTPDASGFIIAQLEMEKTHLTSSRNLSLSTHSEKESKRVLVWRKCVFFLFCEKNNLIKKVFL